MSTSNTTHTLYATSNSSTSTLRPRNTRLISFLDDQDNTSSAAAAITTSSSTSSQNPPLFPSRGSSPSQGVGRTKSLSQRRSASSTSGHGSAHNRKTSEGGPSTAGPDLWSSWSSIASSLLGTESQPSSAKGKAKASSRQPRWMKQDTGYTTSPTASSWGPIAAPPAPSTTEDRRALLEAKKREALLQSTDDRPLNHKHKRRDSNAYSTDFLDDEGDALVYLHRIGKHDTLAGVMLKYGCQADVFRKVNRFWPNDNIQTRKTVVLPVDACSVRGRKVDEGTLTGDGVLRNDKPQALRIAEHPPGGNGDSSADVLSPNASQMSAHDATFPILPTNNDDYRHDSWVTIPSFPTPIQILRLPRKSLGYFPRARRKSVASSVYADDIRDTNNDIGRSSASTPKTSFDTLRHPPTHAAQVNALNLNSVNLNGSPVRRPQFLDSRGRSSSTTSTTSVSTTAASKAKHKQANFVDALRGPGGVGTLRGLRTEPSRPGPAEDAFNRKFGEWFPDTQKSLGLSVDEKGRAEENARLYLNIRGVGVGSLGSSGSGPGVGAGAGLGSNLGAFAAGSALGSARSTPRASFDSVRSTRSNSGSVVGDLGGKIGGLVGKVVGNNRGRGRGATGAGVGGMGSGNGMGMGMGDLIELETNSNSDFGDREDLDANTAQFGAARGEISDEVDTPRARHMPTFRSDAESVDENLLDERFPRPHPGAGNGNGRGRKEVSAYGNAKGKGRA